jgi:conjugal transfer mating pair stabilization protein TraN
MRHLRDQRRHHVADPTLTENTMNYPTFVARPGAGVKRSAVAGAALALFWASATGQSFPAGACSLIPNSQTCVDQTPCKTDSNGQVICLSTTPSPPAGALTISQTCWQYGYTFACAAQSSDTCTPYETNSACTVVSSACQDTIQPTGICDSWTYTYQCQTAPAQTTQQTVCTSTLFNSSGFAALPQLNSNMPAAAVAEEMIREGQLYSNQGLNLFAGVSEYCRKGYGGIQSCCKTAPGAKSNSQMAMVAFGAAAQVVKYVGEEAIDWASPYVFDAMYNNGLWIDAMTDAFATGEDTFGTTLATSGFSVGAYGFTYSTVNTGGLFGGNMQITSFGTDGSDGYLMFNPYVFAASVAILVIEDLASCNSGEQLLAQHKGANLSVYEDESCTQNVLGVCLQYTDRYCSFNSVLAKIIDTQGKAQLGLNASDCSGLTVQQISAIDFTKIDFSQFTQSLTLQATNNTPTSAGIATAYQPIVSTMTGGSAQTRTMTTAATAVGAASAPAMPPNPVVPQYPPAAQGP